MSFAHFFLHWLVKSEWSGFARLHLHLCSVWSQCAPNHLLRWFGRWDHNPSSWLSSLYWGALMVQICKFMSHVWLLWLGVGQVHPTYQSHKRIFVTRPSIFSYLRLAPIMCHPMLQVSHRRTSHIALIGCSSILEYWNESNKIETCLFWQMATSEWEIKVGARATIITHPKTIIKSFSAASYKLMYNIDTTL